MAPVMDIDVKMEKKKRNKSKDITEAEEVMDCADDSSRKDKKKKKKDDDLALIQLIAKYLDKRNLHKSLSSLLSEAQCKSSWKTQAMDLEDIFNQYLIQDSENLERLNVEERNVEQENNCLSINDQNNNAQSELAKSKDKKRKAPGKDIDPDLEKKPRKTDLVKLEKYLQEPVEVTNEAKNKKKKKNTEYKDLIDNDEHKKSSHKEDRSSIKDNTSQETPEVLKKGDKKKKKNSTDKDLVIDNEKETNTNIANGNSIKEKSKPSKSSLKNKESGKLDKSFQEALNVTKEEEKKKSSEDKDLDSLEVPKQKRKKEQVEVEDSGDDANQNGSKKKKKDNKRCKKKLLSPSSNATSEAATNSNLNELAGDTNKPLFDITPGQKGVKEDEREANIALNSKQNSGEPTSAKAFQRVKVQEVEFVDPRLQDNSYWAKSGAEIGYGAKAEQVLGQVRGKDFRHEKTKKKRGSYKGGMIDLQSHSIKFSYSDEE